MVQITRILAANAGASLRRISSSRPFRALILRARVMLVRWMPSAVTASVIPLAWLVSINTLRTVSGPLLPLITAAIILLHVLLLPPATTSESYRAPVPSVLQRTQETLCALLVVYCGIGLRTLYGHPDLGRLVISLNRVWSAVCTISAIAWTRRVPLDTWRMVRLAMANLGISLLIANEVRAILDAEFERSRWLYVWIASLLLLSAGCTPTRRTQLRGLILTASLSELSAETSELLRPSPSTSLPPSAQPAMYTPDDAQSVVSHVHSCTDSYASTWQAEDDYANLYMNAFEAARRR